MPTPETTGYIAAFMSGFLFAGSDVLVRKAVIRLTPRAMLAISLLVGTPLLALFAVVSGDPLPPVKAILAYILAGMFNFVAGRLLFYLAVSALGVATASVLTSPTILVSAFLAAILLGEPLSLPLVVGLSLTTLGVFLASFRPSGVELQGVNYKLGLLSGIASVFMFASSAILVRYAGVQGASPLWGTTISYASALPIVLLYTWRDLSRSVRDKDTLGTALKAAIAAAAIVALAQMSRYIALTDLPVARAVILISLFPIHTIYLSRIAGEALMEEVRINHVLGGALGVMGIIVAYTA